MDMAFLRRAGHMLDERQAAPLDHSILVASLTARRVADVAAAAPEASAGAKLAEGDALAEILLAGPGWRKAVTAQRGSFSRAEAGRRVNGL